MDGDIRGYFLFSRGCFSTGLLVSCNSGFLERTRFVSRDIMRYSNGYCSYCNMEIILYIGNLSRIRDCNGGESVQ